MALPLPRRQAELLSGPPNLSLRFDRGYAGYGADWKYAKPDGKAAFLKSFAAHFNDPHEYKPFLDRREAALRLRSAVVVEATSSTPLLIGLGRWHPTEIGFNFDRFTGCPFIPGSSVKGLLREAAGLVGSAEISDTRMANDSAQYWREHIAAVFGREPAASPAGQKNGAIGSVCFFDAYPATWPRIEVDVMTPHMRLYYARRREVAADWEDPVPIHFLRVEAKTTIRFWFAKRHGVTAAIDLSRLTELLPIALDWLGAGGKKSSGYGWFAGEAAEVSRDVPPPKMTAQRLEWTGAILEYERSTGTLYARQGALKAYAKGKDVAATVPPELLARLKAARRRLLRASLSVIELGHDRKIIEVREWNEE